VLAYSATPTNDDFANAQTISGASGSVNGSNAVATRELSEPYHSFRGRASIWYRWQAPNTGVVTFNTTGSNFNTLLGVYSAFNINSLIASNDFAPVDSNNPASVTFPVVGGTTYFIVIDSRFEYYETTTVGNTVLNWSYNSTTATATIRGQLVFQSGHRIYNQNVALFQGSNFINSVTTDLQGYFQFSGLTKGLNYTVDPGTSFGFNPLTRTYTALSDDQWAVFIAKTPSFNISGVVRGPTNNLLSGISVKLDGAVTLTVTTAADGSYLFPNLPLNSNYRVSPISTGFGFTPDKRDYYDLNANFPNDDYSAANLPPTVTTVAATQLTPTGATLNGNVNPNGVATSGSFEWGTSPTLTTSTATDSQPIGSGTSNQPITANVPGLVAGTTYYFRTVATSSAGTVKGSILSFTTTSATFTISGHVTNTSTASGLGGVSVALSGAATRNTTTNANGDYGFTNLNPGNYTVTPSKPNFTFPVPFRTINNLSSNQTADFTAEAKHRARAGVFRPTTGKIFLKYSNTSGIADTDLTYGDPGDYPLAGDWNGDNIDTVGIYRNGVFYLRNSNTTGPADVPPIRFGDPTDQPVVGDWNGDGIDTIGVYRNGTFYLSNSNTQGAPVFTVTFGNPGDIGIAGDWDGDGIVTIGVFRPSNGLVYLRNSNTTGNSDLDFVFGNADDKPVAGDWNGDGIDTIGIYRNGVFFLSNSNATGFADTTFFLGNTGDFPIAGNWQGLP
jgi:hypothetical protein